MKEKLGLKYIMHDDWFNQFLMKGFFKKNTSVLYVGIGEDSRMCMAILQFL